MRRDEEAIQHRATVLPKIQYLYDYGAQVLTPEEYLYHWATANLKGAQYHYTAHISAKKDLKGSGTSSHEILRLEPDRVKDIWATKNLAPERKLLLEQRFRMMHRILNELLLSDSLEPGTYLLRQRSHASGHLSVLKQASKDSSECESPLKERISIGSIYGQKNYKSPLPNDSLFLPIDTETLLQWHRTLRRIPATFTPRTDTEQPNIYVDSRKRRGSKKGQKGKKRKMSPRDSHGGTSVTDEPHPANQSKESDDKE